MCGCTIVRRTCTRGGSVCVMYVRVHAGQCVCVCVYFGSPHKSITRGRTSMIEYADLWYIFGPSAMVLPSWSMALCQNLLGARLRWCRSPPHGFASTGDGRFHCRPQEACEPPKASSRRTCLAVWSTSESHMVTTIHGYNIVTLWVHGYLMVTL
jgi:hypothetical protein